MKAKGVTVTVECVLGNDWKVSSYAPYSCTATFYILLDGIPFPDESWSDFPLTVLQWWADTLRGQWGTKKKSTFRLSFMDGPVYLECLQNGAELSIRGIINRHHPVCIATCNCGLSDLIDTVIYVGEQALRSLYLTGIENAADKDAFALSIRALKAARNAEKG